MHTFEMSAVRSAPPAGATFLRDSRMAAARIVDTARASSATLEVFGSFLLGEVEFALAASTLREVVNYPARVMPVPLSPRFLDGVFNLRGQVIPVLNLARIFDPAAPASDGAHKVAIVEHDGIQLGIVFDATGEVLRVRPEQRSIMARRDNDGVHAGGVVAGTILLDDGARLLQVLDARALVSIENVPQVQALKATSRSVEKNQFHLLAERRQCVSFRAGGTAFAFEMGAIREIIEVPELKPSVMNGRLCQGRMNFRGSPVAVVDFAALLQVGAPAGSAAQGPCEQGPRSPDQRILISRIGDSLIGLLVDSVDNIFHFFDSDVLPIPLLSKARAGMFAGCMTRDGSDYLFLDHRQIFSQDELLEISAGHVNLYQDEAANGRARAAREVYIAFTLESSWAVPIAQVREIIPFCEGLVRPPGLPGFVHGILNLRGAMVTVIDLRRLYGMPACEACDSAKILMVEDGEERFGLIVDAVDNIVTVPASARRSSPKLLCGANRDHTHADEVLEVPSASGAAATMNVFDRSGFLAMLAAGMQVA